MIDQVRDRRSGLALEIYKASVKRAEYLVSGKKFLKACFREVTEKPIVSLIFHVARQLPACGVSLSRFE